MIARSTLLVAAGLLGSVVGVDAQPSPSLRGLAEFDALPPPVLAALKDVECVVPQASFFVAAPHSVIRGEFAAVGQEDWAVLCSTDGVSSIHVVFGGPATCPSPIRPSPDLSFFQGTGPDSGPQFSRLIDAVPELRSLDHPPLRAPFDSVAYSGIADLFVEKGGEIITCIDGAWHSFSID